MARYENPMESQILGGLLRHPEIAREYARQLTEEDFLDLNRHAIFRGILYATAELDRISPESVAQAIEITRKGNTRISAEELSALFSNAPENIDEYKKTFERFRAEAEEYRPSYAKLHLAAQFDIPLPKPDHVLPGLLAGTVGGLVSPGATGKSIFASQLGIALASESAGGNLIGLNISKPGPVLIVSAEDPEEIVLERARAVFQRIGNPAVTKEVLRHFRVWCALGQRSADLMDARWRETLMRQMDGCRLVILDTLSNFHHLDENKANEAGQLMSWMKYMAKRTGCALLYLHHVSKGTALNGMADLQQAARGSSVLVDQARWLAFVARMDKTDCERLRLSIPEDQYKWWIRFGASKLNYAAPLDDIWLRREEGGVLVQHDPRTYQPGDRSIPLRVMRGRGND